MQIASLSRHYVIRRALPLRSGPLSILGGRVLVRQAPPAPRATGCSQPAVRTFQLRCYTQGRPANGAEAAAECAFQPEQVQQVLRICRGIGFSVIAAAAGQQPDVLKGMVAIFFSSRAAAHAEKNRAAVQSVLPWPRFYDPDGEHSAQPANTFMLSVDGSLGVHSRNVQLSYLVLSDQPWSIIVGGVRPVISGQAGIPCTEIGFPANSLVQLNLAEGMLHGFEGRFGAVCSSFAGKKGWSWPWSRGSAEPGWPGCKSVELDPARMRRVGGGAVPWNVVRKWQNTIALEKSPEALAYEHARLHGPL